MFIISIYDRQTGIPLRSENAETYIEATEIQYRFQDMAEDGFGVMVTDGYPSMTFEGFHTPQPE